MACEMILKSFNCILTALFVSVSAAFMTYGGLSTFALVDLNSDKVLNEEYVALSSLLMAVFGALLLIFSIFGCCGLCRNSPCCIESYAVFLILLALAQIGLGVFSLVRFSFHNKQLESKLNTDIAEMFIKYDTEPKLMDNLQASLGCCGITDSDDYIRAKRLIPQTCCGNNTIIGLCNWLSPDKHQDGCLKLSFNFIIGTNTVIGCSLIAVAIVEIFAAIFAICVSCGYWRNKY